MAKKILFISPEVYPEVKVGGLGKMVAGVVKGLMEMDVEVKIVSPGENIYNPLWKKETKDDYRKLGLEAVWQCQRDKWQPDWLWIHDWGGVWAAAEFLKAKTSKIIWTVHSPVGDNYGYEYGYGYCEDDAEPIDWGDSFFDFAALVNQGVAMTDLVTTVSPSFARRLVRNRLFQDVESIVGVKNGIDGENWNPEKDRLIGFKFKDSWLEFKNKNRQILQEKFNLPVENIPVFSFVSRVVPQKGVRLLLDVLPKFLAKNSVQFVFVGTGRRKLLQLINKLKSDFPTQVGTKLEADFDLPHQVFAGADFFVLPSTSEPFGIAAAEARKYGAIPIVHLVDGLQDQIKDGQNGFGFWQYNQEKLREKLNRALDSWRTEWQFGRWGNWAGIDNWQDVSQNWLSLFHEQQ